MKKRFLLSLCMAIALVALCLLALPTQAEAVAEVDYSYTISNNKATITKYNGHDWDITIPEVLGGCPVTTIGNNAFLHCNIGSVSVPDSVTTIEDGAFLNSNLQAIRIGKGASYIDRNAFNLCYQLCFIRNANTTYIAM